MKNRTEVIMEEFVKLFKSGKIDKEFWYDLTWEQQEFLFERAELFGIDVSKDHHQIEYYMINAYSRANMKEKEPQQAVHCLICGEIAGYEPIRPGIKDSVLAFCKKCV